MTIKDCLYRELRYGSTLTGLVAGDHIKLDMRNAPSSTKAEADYPYVVFRRVTRDEVNQTKLSTERIEIEVIGLRSSATKGDAILEQISMALVDKFAGVIQTWGKYDDSGNADPSGGLKLKGFYVSTVEGFSQELDEKAHILIFRFTYLR